MTVCKMTNLPSCFEYELSAVGETSIDRTRLRESLDLFESTNFTSGYEQWIRPRARSMSTCSVAGLTAHLWGSWVIRIACYILSARRERRVCRAIRN